MSCITSVTYTVNINGEQHGMIKPTCGLRQGDPLSPYMFILCAEALTAVINKNIYDGLYRGCRVSKSAPLVTHTMYADDVLLFGIATKEELQTVDRMLERYSRWSGQKLNKDKSGLLFSNNVALRDAESLAHASGYKLLSKDTLYLGTPMWPARGRSTQLNYITEKMLGRMQTWKINTLTQAGRTILIKSVIASIPTHIMATQLLPRSIWRKMSAIQTNFWWGEYPGRKRLHFYNKEILSRHKSCGGLGFRDFEGYNRASIMKVAWRLNTEDQSTWIKLMKDKYLKSGTLWEANEKLKGSHIWRGIMQVRNELKLGRKWQVQSGENINIWKDNWIPSLPHPPSPAPNCNLPLPHKVSELIRHSKWDTNKLLLSFSPELANLIMRVPIPRLSNLEDKQVWAYTDSGLFTTKSAYRLVMDSRTPSSSSPNILWKTVWNPHLSKSIPPKVSLFLWKCSTNTIPTKTNIARRIPMLDSLCPVYRKEAETLEHLLFLCPGARAVWKSSSLNLHVDAIPGAFPDFLIFCANKFSMQVQDELRHWFHIIAILWQIWKSRCALVFEGNHLDPRLVAAKAWAEALEWQPQARVYNYCNINTSLIWNPPCPNRSRLMWMGPS